MIIYEQANRLSVSVITTLYYNLIPRLQLTQLSMTPSYKLADQETMQGAAAVNQSTPESRKACASYFQVRCNLSVSNSVSKLTAI